MDKTSFNTKYASFTDRWGLSNPTKVMRRLPMPSKSKALGLGALVGGLSFGADKMCAGHKNYTADIDDPAVSGFNSTPQDYRCTALPAIKALESNPINYHHNRAQKDNGFPLGGVNPASGSSYAADTINDMMKALGLQKEYACLSNMMPSERSIITLEMVKGAGVGAPSGPQQQSANPSASSTTIQSSKLTQPTQTSATQSAQSKPTNKPATPGQWFKPKTAPAQNMQTNVH